MKSAEFVFMKKYTVFIGNQRINGRCRTLFRRRAEKRPENHVRKRIIPSMHHNHIAVDNARVCHVDMTTFRNDLGKF